MLYREHYKNLNMCSVLIFFNFVNLKFYIKRQKITEKLLIKAEQFISHYVCNSCKNTKKTYNKRQDHISNIYFYIAMLDYSNTCSI